MVVRRREIVVRAMVNLEVWSLASETWRPGCGSPRSYGGRPSAGHVHAGRVNQVLGDRPKGAGAGTPAPHRRDTDAWRVEPNSRSNGGGTRCSLESRGFWPPSTRGNRYCSPGCPRPACTGGGGSLPGRSSLFTGPPVHAAGKPRCSVRPPAETTGSLRTDRAVPGPWHIRQGAPTTASPDSRGGATRTNASESRRTGSGAARRRSS